MCSFNITPIDPPSVPKGDIGDETDHNMTECDAEKASSNEYGSTHVKRRLTDTDDDIPLWQVNRKNDIPPSEEEGASLDCFASSGSEIESDYGEENETFKGDETGTNQAQNGKGTKEQTDTQERTPKEVVDKPEHVETKINPDEDIGK